MLLNFDGRVAPPSRIVFREICDYGDVMSVEEFNCHCESGSLIDYDGSGTLCKDGLDSNILVRPSSRHLIPEWCDSICWFNR